MGADRHIHMIVYCQTSTDSSKTLCAVHALSASFVVAEDKLQTRVASDDDRHHPQEETPAAAAAARRRMEGGEHIHMEMRMISVQRIDSASEAGTPSLQWQEISVDQ